MKINEMLIASSPEFHHTQVEDNVLLLKLTWGFIGIMKGAKGRVGTRQ